MLSQQADGTAAAASQATGPKSAAHGGLIAGAKPGFLSALVARLGLSSMPRSVIVASVFINLLGLGLPLVALQIYDRIIPNQATDTLTLLIVGLVIVIGLDVFMKVLRSYVVGWQSTREACRAHLLAVDRLLTAPLAQIAKARHMDWMDRFDALAQINAAGAVTSRLVLLDLVFLPIYLVIFALISGWLVLVPLAVVAPFVLLVFRRGEHLRASVDLRSSQDRRKHDFLIECLNGMRAIKVMAMEPLMQRRYERLQKSSAEASFQVISDSQKLQAHGVLMSALATISVVSVGALMIMAGNLSIGALAASSLLSGRLMQPAMRGVGVWSEFQNRQVARRRVAPLLELTPQFKTGEDARSRQCRGAVRFSGVHYGNPQSGKMILQHINLEVRAGEMIGLRTSDSTAKRALLELLRGDLAPTRGSVMIDGRPVVDGWGDGLSRHLVSVSNRSSIVNGTILENLTMFCLERTEVARAMAEAVGLESYINQMPQGYDTPIGGAVKRVLPAGMAQQVTIARALACKPSVLLFDEANSVLDRGADQAVLKALVSLKGTCTVVLACQRPSYLAQADQVFDIVDGALVALESSGEGAGSPASRCTAG
ncbi:MAG: peptidase domain-containing ABC transporter, partial [Hyphomicrobiales bacterium]